MFTKEGRSGYDTPKNIDQVRIIVVKVDSELYDLDDRIETEESIRKILIEKDLEGIIEELYISDRST